MTALEQAQALLPSGIAWTRRAGAWLTLLLTALSAEFDRVQGRALDALDEQLPGDTSFFDTGPGMTEMLPEWIALRDTPRFGGGGTLIGGGIINNRRLLEAMWRAAPLSPLVAADVAATFGMIFIQHFVTGAHTAALRLLGTSNPDAEAFFRFLAHITASLTFDYVALTSTIDAPASPYTASSATFVVNGTAEYGETVTVRVVAGGTVVGVFDVDPGTNEWFGLIGPFNDESTFSLVARASRSHLGVEYALDSAPLDVTIDIPASGGDFNATDFNATDFNTA